MTHPQIQKEFSGDLLLVITDSGSNSGYTLVSVNLICKEIRRALEVLKTGKEKIRKVEIN